jgi:putative ABC transport system permease protein
MFINNLRIAFRYLIKNRTFSFINIFGLTSGFICFILITLFLQNELSYDMFHTDASRIFRVLQHEQKDGVVRDVAPVAARIGPEAASQFPEVEDAIRISAIGRITMGNDPANRDYESITLADSNFFRFFDFPLIQGDPDKALATPNGVVLSETTARKYFGNEPALGKRIWTSTQEFTVTGIMKDAPKDSHLKIELVFAEVTWANYFDFYKNFVASDWKSNSFITYIKVREGANAAVLSEKITSLVKKNYPADQDFNSTFSLQPLQNIHLYSDNIQGIGVNASGIKPFYLYMFGAVAFLILFIACLNYMNLSTAAAYKRTREIGTRKTLGAQRLQLIMQFSGEALLLALFSLAIAMAFIQVVLPAVNAFLEKDLSIGNLPPNWLMAVIAAMILSGILSSLYPAYIISKVSPAEAIKRDVKFGNRSIPVRKMLVVVQFSISIMMIASTIIIYRQLQFMRNKDLGFDLDNLLVIDINSNSLRRDFENVKAQFKSIPEVQAISTSTRVPGEWKSFPITTIRTNSERQLETIFVGIDGDFLNTYNIKLVEGRNFNGTKSDSLKVILTKLAVEELGLKDPIGQVIEIPTVRSGGNIQNLETPFRAEVIGIADNFHFESFRQKMMPLVFAYANTPIQRIDYYTMRIRTNDWQATIAKLKEVNNKLTADDPLEYTFLDGRFEEFYQADVKRGQIFITFSFIIVLIACLGLFALVSYAIESRTKEIGIRKVLGASVRNILQMISSEFLALVIISSVIAIPITIYLMKKWLQDFAYHIPLAADIFILASAIAVIIALATISFRSVKAAIMNPVKSLRSE